MRWYNHNVTKKIMVSLTSRINIDKLAKELGVDQLAIDQALKNLPQTSAQGPDAAEQRIVQAITEMHHDFTAQYARRLEDEQAQLAQLLAQANPEYLEECYEATK